jgi:hypothetical protein
MQPKSLIFQGLGDRADEGIMQTIWTINIYLNIEVDDLDGATCHDACGATC